MLIAYARVPELAPFVALIVNEDEAAVAGIPEIKSAMPVDVPSESPAGKFPEETLQVNGPAAVVEAVMVWKYAIPAVPLGSETGFIESTGDGGGSAGPIVTE